MASIGWTMGRMAIYASFALLAIWKGPDTQIHEHEPEIVSTKKESAFETKLYHDLVPPYSEYRCLPKRIHLSQASDVTENKKSVNMTVSFTLDNQHCQDSIPTVVYSHGIHHPKKAETPDPLHFNFTSSQTQEYYESDWIYHVVMPNLQPDTFYSYRIVVHATQQEGLASSSSWERRRRRLLREPLAVVAETPEFYFRTPPLPGSPTTLALLGDLGQTLNSTKTMSHIHKATLTPKHPVTLTLLVGDMSYADSEPERWESWFELMEPLLRSTPLEVAAGNHEVECDNNTRDIFVPYENYFSNANRLGPAETLPVDDQYRKKLWNESCSTPSQFIGTYNYGNAFYTFVHGLVRVIVLSSYSHTERGSVQYKWLKETLQQVDRKVTPWLIVGFHCPLYTTFLGHNAEPQSQRMKEHMEPLFVEYGVNLIVSGHDHAYMRTHPLAFGNVTKDAPVYLILGAGGNREEHTRGYLHPDQAEPWVAKRDRFEYGYGHLKVPNATHAFFQWVRDGTTDEGIRDRVWFVNPHV